MSVAMWDELGIAPSDDPKAIRRAYAMRLKQLDPDRDPGAFARLREAYEQALDPSRRNGPRRAAQQAPAEDDADDIADDGASAPPRRLPAKRTAAPGDRVANRYQPLTANDQDDIRDRALLIALDAALREGNASEAIALYYRAAATGALPLAAASDLITRLVAAAVDDTALGGAAFRRLIRIVGLDASRVHAPVDSELRRRALARLAAEDWYDDLLAKAGRRRGRIARNQRRIARLLLGRIGRYWQPRVDSAALRTWLKQYQVHAPWLADRIDPRWIGKLEGRLRRRQIFGAAFGILFIGSLLLNFALVAFFGSAEDDSPLSPYLVAPLLVAFFLWIFLLLVREFLKLVVPGWRGFASIAALRELARGARALWDRLAAKGRGAG